MVASCHSFQETYPYTLDFKAIAFEMELGLSELERTIKELEEARVVRWDGIVNRWNSSLMVGS